MKKCIVAVAARVGDAELGAGGTIAKYVAAGYRAVLVVTTTSVAVPPVGLPADALTPVELCTLREREAREAAALLGYELLFLRCNERFYWHRGQRQHVDFSDRAPEAKMPGRGFFGQGTPCQVEVRNALKDLLLREEPELVLTHAASDACYERWLTARFLGPVYAEVAREPGLVGRLLSWDAGRGNHTMPLPVCAIADITDYRRAKHAALARLAATVSAEAMEALRLSEEHWGAMVRERSAPPLYGEPFLSLRTAVAL
jgi:LmbE family N-acetylglucosaminyl deacetylase